MLALIQQPTVTHYGAQPCPEVKDWASCPDAWPAFRAAIDAMARPGEGKNRGGRVLRLGAVTYRLSRTLELDRGVTLRGETGSWMTGRSRLLFDPGVVGLHLTGGRPIVQDVVVESAEGRCTKPEQWKEGKCKSGVDGVLIESRAHLERVYVTQFPGNGFHVSADHHRQPSTNANGFMMVDCQAERNSGDGMTVDGGDANAGLAIRLQATNNGGWGIRESSFLGNTYLGCGISSNDTGAVLSEKSAARNLFIGCYVEAGEIGGKVRLRYPSMWLSGWGGQEGDALFMGDGALRGGRWRAENDTDPKDKVSLGFGSPNNPRTALELHSSADRHPYRLEHGTPREGWWGLQHANADGRVALAFSGSGAAEGEGQAWAPNGLFLGKTPRHLGVGKPPSEPRKGDIVLSEDPAKDGWLGRVCVDPGDPKSKREPRWKRFGKLED